MDAAADPKRRLSYDAQQAALLGEMRDDAAVCAAVWAMVLQALRVSVPPTHALHHVHYVQHAAGQWTSVIERMRGGLSASGISRHTLQAERVERAVELGRTRGAEFECEPAPGFRGDVPLV